MATFINPYGAGCACARAECTDDCCVYKRYKPEPKPITHGDRIRSMTDEELVEIFANNDCGYCRIHDFCFTKGSAINCEDVWLDWIRREAEEEGE